MQFDAVSGDKPRYAQGGEALLDAAARVFAAQGVSGLTYRSVATAAQVTHGLVGYHFGSRQGLVHATLARVAEECIELSEILPDSGRLEDFLRELPEMTAEDPDIAVAQFELAVLGCRDPAVIDEARDLYRRYIEVTGEALERFGADVERPVARLVFAAIDGLIMQQLLFGSIEETEECLSVLRDMLARLLD